MLEQVESRPGLVGRTFNSLEEALEFSRKEYEARPLIKQEETQNGNLIVNQTFDEKDKFNKERYPRMVTSITISDGEHVIDLCALAPEKTTFLTSGAVYVIGGIKRESRFPVAEAGKNPKTGERFVNYNPDVLKQRGGILLLLHEIGHTWDEVSRHPEKIIESFAQGKKYPVEKVRKALLEKRARENFAWRFAVAKYREFLEQGFNLTPQIPEKEINSYPQLVFDTLLNIDGVYIKAIAFAGRDYRLVWEEK